MNQMIKMFLCLLAVFGITAALAPQTVFAYDYEINGVQYTVMQDGNAKVSGYSGGGGAVTILDTVEGHKVTGIEAYAFRLSTGIGIVTIPDSVTSIGSSAFMGCYNLTTVNYEGSKTQWDAVSKGAGWNSGCHGFQGVTYGAWDVTITAGANMAATSGDPVQAVKKETDMTPVTFTAAAGFRFPADYSVPNLPDGLSVARSSDGTQITVSGKPKADLEITLPAATMKPTLTITAKDQEYLYNGKQQGPGDAAYNDAAQIAEVIIVEGLQGGDTITAVILDGQATEIGTHKGVLNVTGFTINKNDPEAKERYDIVLVPGNITIKDPASIYDVTITPGAGMKKTDDSGDLSQTVYNGGKMDDVVFTAADGYYFPEDYPSASVKGVSVTRDSDSQITVAGTPTADTKLTLSDAKRKDVPPHVHTLELVEAKEATCTEEGNTAYYVCTICGLWFEDATALKEITDKSTVIIKPTGHRWDDGVVTKEPTYTEEGIRTYTCLNNSSHKKEEAIPKKRRSSGGGSGGSSSGSVSGKRSAGGSWSQDASGWHYKENGVLLKNAWKYLPYNGVSYWYYFDENGTMKTGWFEQNGNRYYLYPVSDGWMGRMVTGWLQIGGKWYFFETAPGTDQGRMYRSGRTPDGYYVGPDGAWDGNPADQGT